MAMEVEHLLEFNSFLPVPRVASDEEMFPLTGNSVSGMEHISRQRMVLKWDMSNVVMWNSALDAIHESRMICQGCLDTIFITNRKLPTSE